MPSTEHDFQQIIIPVIAPNYVVPQQSHHFEAFVLALCCLTSHQIAYNLCKNAIIQACNNYHVADVRCVAKKIKKQEDK